MDVKGTEVNASVEVEMMVEYTEDVWLTVELVIIVLTNPTLRFPCGTLASRRMSSLSLQFQSCIIVILCYAS